MWTCQHLKLELEQEKIRVGRLRGLQKRLSKNLKRPEKTNN